MQEWEAARFRTFVIPSPDMAPNIMFTAAGPKEEARKIARSLVESRLAACVNVIPKIESVYRWEDNVQAAEEWLLLIKTSSMNFEAVQEAIRKLHSYDLPECIAIKITEGEEKYLEWLTENSHS